MHAPKLIGIRSSRRFRRHDRGHSRMEDGHGPLTSAGEIRILWRRRGLGRAADASSGWTARAARPEIQGYRAEPVVPYTLAIRAATGRQCRHVQICTAEGPLTPILPPGTSPSARQVETSMRISAQHRVGRASALSGDLGLDRVGSALAPCDSASSQFARLPGGSLDDSLVHGPMRRAHAALAIRPLAPGVNRADPGRQPRPPVTPREWGISTGTFRR